MVNITEPWGACQHWETDINILGKSLFQFIKKKRQNDQDLSQQLYLKVASVLALNLIFCSISAKRDEK